VKTTAVQERRYYNALDEYESGLKKVGWAVPRLLVKYLKPLLNGGELMLDVGCGPGFVGTELKRASWQGKLIGVDIAERRLKESAAKSIYTSCAHANAYRLCFPSGTFDVVVSSAMVGLTGTSSVCEMWRVLKIGGILACVAGEFKKESWSRRRLRDSLRRFTQLPCASQLLRLDLGRGYLRDSCDNEHYVLAILRKTG